MSKYTNNTNLPLSIAVWLATDNYQYPPNDGKKYISATGLMKSLRQIILGQRLPKGENEKINDISSQIASRFGTALHDSIEKAWEENQINAMKSLGYPDKVVNRVRVNPTDLSEPNIIPVYMEQRFHKEINGWNVSGQFDFVGDGKLEDFKSTGTFTWVNNTKDEDYIQQGSIYRWGRPDIITKDIMSIQFIFKDWMKFKVSDPKYPPAMIVQKEYRLKSIEETDRFIKNKLKFIDDNVDTLESELPQCTPKELWQGKPTYKYYKDKVKAATKGSRSTKNFDTPQEANLRFVQDGSVGIVIPTVPEPVACRFCPVLHICSQGQGYIKSGALKT